MGFLFSDLSSIKQILQIDPNDHSEDWLFLEYNKIVTNVFENLLNRQGAFAFGQRTRYYPGTGCQKLLLKDRPVYPYDSNNVLQLFVTVDESGNYGQAPGAFAGTPLVYGVDYTINIDQDDGGSNEAILYRVGNYWPRPIVRQTGLLSPFVGNDLGSVKVTSTAGWTIDTVPTQLKLAAYKLIAKLAYLFPLGTETTSESYIDRSISISPTQQDYLYGLVKQDLWYFRNWKF